MEIRIARLEIDNKRLLISLLFSIGVIFSYTYFSLHPLLKVQSVNHANEYPVDWLGI